MKIEFHLIFSSGNWEENCCRMGKKISQSNIADIAARKNDEGERERSGGRRRWRGNIQWIYSSCLVLFISNNIYLNINLND